MRSDSPNFLGIEVKTELLTVSSVYKTTHKNKCLFSSSIVAMNVDLIESFVSHFFPFNLTDWRHFKSLKSLFKVVQEGHTTPKETNCC